MEIKKIPVGSLQANCYLVILNEKCLIIDPGAEREKILESLKNLTVVGILLTHNHFDHNGELEYFEQKYHLKANDKVKDFNYTVINTPGHTEDSKTFYFPEEKIMFTGDFLFQNSIGRMDLPTGSEEDMLNSLINIAKYNEDIIIYPGHGPSSTLKAEKDNIAYFINLLK